MVGKESGAPFSDNKNIFKNNEYMGTDDVIAGGPSSLAANTTSLMYRSAGINNNNVITPSIPRNQGPVNTPPPHNLNSASAYQSSPPATTTTSFVRPSPNRHLPPVLQACKQQFKVLKSSQFRGNRAVNQEEIYQDTKKVKSRN